MNPNLEADNYFTIKLLSYDCPTEQVERYYFSEMSTLQATTLIQPNTIIISAKIYAYNDEDEIFDNELAKSFIRVSDFNEFFLKHEDFYIYNCDLELENGMIFGSHDDGEVSIQLFKDGPDKSIIDRIFEKYNLDKGLADILKSKSGHYLSIDKESNVIGDYADFNEYVELGRF